MDSTGDGVLDIPDERLICLMTLSSHVIPLSLTPSLSLSLWFEQETLDKDGFLKEIEQKLIIIAMNMVDDYEKDYRDALVTLLEQIKSEFRNNLDRYSQRMKVMIDNREAMRTWEVNFGCGSIACAMSGIA